MSDDDPFEDPFAAMHGVLFALFCVLTGVGAFAVAVFIDWLLTR